MRLSFFTVNYRPASLLLSVLFLFFVGVLPVQAEDLTAREIMEKVDARDDGDNITIESEMILIDKNGHERTRLLKSFIKDKGADTWRTQFFIEPADVRDTAFLTYDYYSGDKDDDQWLYLPELHKTKRIASSDKSSAFMGSDFSYADMNRRVLDEWSYELLKEDSVDGNKVWLIEATPVNKVVEECYGYSKSVVFIRQDIFFPVRAVHWLKEGNKIKYMEVKKLEQIDGIWVATETHMKTTKSKETTHKTILRWHNIKMNQAIDDDMFTVRRIEKGL
ncbi:MAG: outer membrane lipoprotein-sorting protein [Proteobacteria bacterium]|nr:outer membrane lipoprotein-sorting protein [Pseudomonadota bacterium]MBU1641506.1 outer membrane lipoprotein-sorting protein [Pseudomonadota bacterium]